MVLSTKEKILRDLRISESDVDRIEQAEDALKAASDWIEKYLDRQLPYDPEFKQVLEGHGFPELILSRYPISEIHSIEVDGESVDPDEYIVRPEKGMVYRRRGWPPSMQYDRRDYIRTGRGGTEAPLIEVVYSGGYVTPQQAIDDQTLERSLPSDIEKAALFVASTMFRSMGDDMRVRRAHNLRTGTWYSDEEFKATVDSWIGHHRSLA